MGECKNCQYCDLCDNTCMVTGEKCYTEKNKHPTCDNYRVGEWTTMEG